MPATDFELATELDNAREAIRQLAEQLLQKATDGSDFTSCARVATDIASLSERAASIQRQMRGDP